MTKQSIQDIEKEIARLQQEKLEQEDKEIQQKRLEQHKNIYEKRSKTFLKIIIFLTIFMLGLIFYFTQIARTPVLDSEITISATGLPILSVYKDVPIWLNVWFAVAVIAVITIIIISLYLYFRISLRNRTNVIIHMPDGKRQHISFKNFSGRIFKVQGYEKDKDNNPIYYNYIFRPEALETGYFGNYIEYDYGILEPISHTKRMLNYPQSYADVLKFVSAMLNTQLPVDLLLSSKFKEFVKMFLIIIAIEVLIAILIGGYIIYALQQDSITTCILVNSTQNTEIIRNALIR